MRGDRLAALVSLRPAEAGRGGRAALALHCRCSSWARSTARRAPVPLLRQPLATRTRSRRSARGGAEEFAAFAWQGECPTRESAETFERSRLNQELRAEGRHAALDAFYKELIRLRKAVPALMARLSKEDTEAPTSRKRWSIARPAPTGADEGRHRLPSTSPRRPDLDAPRRGTGAALDSAGERWGVAGGIGEASERIRRRAGRGLRARRPGVCGAMHDPPEPMNRYLCIHGHFYQPPRENPWLEAVEVQDSAYPYHDWNERITAECYAPERRVAHPRRRASASSEIVNNYAADQLQLRPDAALAGWRRRRPEVYGAILDADRESRERFSGHGSAHGAGVQPHDPAAGQRARQAHAGALGHRATSSAASAASPRGCGCRRRRSTSSRSKLLAEAGHRASRSWRRTRRSACAQLGDDDWQDVERRRASTRRMPYRCNAALGPVDRPLLLRRPDLARGRLREAARRSGERFADRLLGALLRRRGARPQLVHIATDGETYGHHHRYGDMALAYALAPHRDERARRGSPTTASSSRRHPPTHEVEIVENTAWSCAHGVERWRERLRLHTGGGPGWNQAWRAPLREALDWLRDELRAALRGARRGRSSPTPGRRATTTSTSSSTARPRASTRFLDAPRRPPLERRRAGRGRSKLLELQRHAMLMYTSCGWFFNDSPGSRRSRCCATPAAWSSSPRSSSATAVEAELPAAPGAGEEQRRREHGNGARHLREARAAGHASTCRRWPRTTPSPRSSRTIADPAPHLLLRGRARERPHASAPAAPRLAIGRARVTSELTGETAAFDFGVLHFGDHNLNAGVRPLRRRQEALRAPDRRGRRAPSSTATCRRSIRLLDRYFGDVPYSLRSLFRDEQRRILDLILASTLGEVEGEFRDVFRASRAADALPERAWARRCPRPSPPPPSSS